MTAQSFDRNQVLKPGYEQNSLASIFPQHYAAARTRIHLDGGGLLLFEPPEPVICPLMRMVMGKYDDLLSKLEDYEKYSAGMIVRLAKEIGYAQTHLALLRIRINLNGKATRKAFPDLGDGWVRLQGQGPTPGWFGWRWKTLIPQDE